MSLLNILINMLILMTIILHSRSADIHGGTFLTVCGKDCIAIASDSRFKSYQTGNIMLGQHHRRVLRVGMETLIGCYGLESDVFTLKKLIHEKVNESRMSYLDVPSIATIVSDILYNNDLLCMPMVIGLQKDKKPFICGMDGLGAQTLSESYAVMGTANEGLMAICESLYHPSMSPSDLIQFTKTVFAMALQRDVLSGCRVRILVIANKSIYSTEFDAGDS
jgi:20S proteasome subunit beta 3